MSTRNANLELAAVAAALLLPIPLFVASGLRLPLPSAVERGLTSLGTGGGDPSAASRPAPTRAPAAPAARPRVSAEARPRVVAPERWAMSSVSLVYEPPAAPAKGDDAPSGVPAPRGDGSPPAEEEPQPPPTPPVDAPRPGPEHVPGGGSAGVEVTPPAQAPLANAAAADEGVRVDAGGESVDVPVPETPRPEDPTPAPPIVPDPVPVPLP